MNTTFSINPPINLPEQDKCLLSVSSSETTNYVSNIIDENNSFSISIPGHRNSKLLLKKLLTN